MFSAINKNIHIRTQNKEFLWTVSIMLCYIQLHFSKFQCITGRILRCCTSLSVWKHCLNPLSDWGNKCLRWYSAILTQIPGAPACLSSGNWDFYRNNPSQHRAGAPQLSSQNHLWYKKWEMASLCMDTSGQRLLLLPPGKSSRGSWNEGEFLEMDCKARLSNSECMGDVTPQAYSVKVLS